MTRQPQVGDRVTVTASMEALSEICAERALGLTGRVRKIDSEAHTNGVRHPFLIGFGPRAEWGFWLRRSDFTLMDEEPDEPEGPDEPVRTKAETLDLMKDVLRAIAEYEDLSRPWVTKEGHEHLVTASETELVTSGYRALYEKLKESL